ncbi:MAG: hypothetical protein EXR99_16665 [Gemmataceae bacterium]|nr:hypothetical protein [Gemmataceae bacterium]
MVNNLVFTLILGSFLVLPVAAQEPKEEPFLCHWAKQPPKIDGQGDDPCWKGAAEISHFYLPWLGEKARKSKTATRARLLWDWENLYFLASMEDADLFADVREHDGQTWNNDVFELFFRPDASKGGYYEFQVNAANTIFDAFFPKRNLEGILNQSKADRFHVEAKVALKGTLNQRNDQDTGWSVEGKIPWIDFSKCGGRPQPGETWRFALCRYDYDKKWPEPELSTCAPLKDKKHADFHLVENYAPLRFEGPLPTGQPAVRISAKDLKVAGSPEPPTPYKTVPAYPGLKLKFPIFTCNQPGTRLMLVSCQDQPYAVSSIQRFNIDKPAEKPEHLFESKDSIYDILFHPKFAENGFVYFGCNGPSPDGKKRTRVIRYSMETKPPFKLDQASVKTIIEWHSDGHNGGAIAFDNEGIFYVTSGDGTSDSDTWVSGQDMTRPLGKVLRINLDKPEGGKEYAVPQDNPFLKLPGAVPETWAYGLRNPWRMHFDKVKGHLWVGNNGQDLWEQIFFVRKGDNFGWSVMEGSHPFYQSRQAGPTPFVKPAAEHHHAEARSLTGGISYYGKKIPALKGFYIYGDYSTGKIWGMDHDGNRVVKHLELADTSHQITAFALDPDDNLLVVDHQGIFYKLVENDLSKPRPSFPRKLSETGLFKQVKGRVPHAALIPYSVNAPLWSDNAHKERFLVLPELGADGKPSTIDIATNRGWNFPDGAVLVKSFALDIQPGNPAMKKWVETRLLTKQEGEWVGYSYRWNEAQDEADLVEASGRDEKIEIAGAGGGKSASQVWHYPSRAECMVCHSRAVNYVLGLNEAQMNRDFPYPHGTMNQLAYLESRGLLRARSQEEFKNAIRRTGLADGKKDKVLDDWVQAQMETKEQRKLEDGSTLLGASPVHLKKLVDPSDKAGDLQLRARSYLQANCANCHVEAGGGNSQIDLEFSTSLEKMKLLGIKPVHAAFDLKDPLLVKPGHPEESVLMKRVSLVGQGQMPPLARNLTDPEGVALLREWIQSLKK